MELRVKEITKSKGLTMQQLSEKLGVTRDTLTRNVNGNPTIETLSKIATALEVPIWQLFASPEEVQLPSNAHSIKCPHCGNEFPVSVNVELKTQNKD
ncbi:helix-turn-helix transcriptional regulator [Bacteroides ovatus]|uniref:helix-turn-helix domain-containing protein n=1 Tax=Bacteroides TaxID=816 RepID=UPI000E3FB6DC|nr:MULTISPECIES: helix-turn-helix transcriptional regulator [Bacteroides]MDC2747232.1 helix-turn-helix transcriptional regulator [Bacteroides ovatus]MDC2756877.1 helix-turn-helix transcriptional regulator [Bacteroides ovatus]RGE77149.1 XRE family transcriptional regulator [Bacteroides sp. AF32-8BH]